MSERKVLNKYYPPDFDPSKLPRLKKEKSRDGRKKDKTFNIRSMAPCNMKCLTCGEYIYKGRKFNSRLETVQGETYLGLRIYRMYIKCPRCLSEITFKTDLKNEDYELEHGATRNFDSIRLAERAETQRIEAEKAELESNPMKVLEERTKQSQFEIEMHETLEDLRALRDRHAHVDTRSLLSDVDETHKRKVENTEDDEERRLIEAAFGKKIRQVVDVEKQSVEGPSTSSSHLISEKPSTSSSSQSEKPGSSSSTSKKHKNTPGQSPFTAKRSVVISYDDDDDDEADDADWKPAEKKRNAVFIAPSNLTSNTSVKQEDSGEQASVSRSAADDKVAADSVFPSKPAEQPDAAQQTEPATTSSSKGVSMAVSTASVSTSKMPGVTGSATSGSSQKSLNSALAGLKKSLIVRKK